MCVKSIRYCSMSYFACILLSFLMQLKTAKYLRIYSVSIHLVEIVGIYLDVTCLLHV